ncbi:MAG: ParA family protein [Alphaproteobacteria bacterium]|nr:ParA family protein [Alphaproteobacteria bacterium]
MTDNIIPLYSTPNTNNAKIISIVNCKGGVGKTTTAINIASILASSGKKTLLIDFDSQANSTTGLNLTSKSGISLYDVIINENSIKDLIIPTKVENLDLVPATLNLLAAEAELFEVEKREFRLRNAISKCNDYDYIIIDCAPNLGFLTINALTASNSVIIPLQCEFFALEGIHYLVKTISFVNKTFNPNLTIEGVVLTMYDSRNKLSDLVVQEIRECFGDKVFKTLIPRNVKIPESQSHGVPVIFYDYRSTGATAYERLTAEILDNNEKVQDTIKYKGL